MAGFLSKFVPRLRTGFPQPEPIPVDEFLRALTTIVGLDQLLENFSSKLKENLQVETVFLVLYEPITNRYIGRKAKGIRSKDLDLLNFSKNDNLIKWLNVNRAILELEKSPECVLDGR